MKNKILNFIDNMSYTQFFLIIVPVIGIVSFLIFYVIWAFGIIEKLI